MKIFTLLASLFVTVFSLTPVTTPISGNDTATEASVHTDISYGDFERNKMDIYLPKKDTTAKSFGALIFIHGGSWTSGDKSSEAYLCKKYVEKGYVTATINYHYIDNNNAINSNMDDISSAIEKLKSFCSEKGYNVEKLALHGYSSGAHLATLFSYAYPEKSSIPLAFVVNMAGPSDFNSNTWNEWDYDENTGPGLATLLYGVNSDQSKSLQDKINAVSPTFYINKNSIPTICGYAGDGKDGIVPTKNKTITFAKLKEHNVKNACFSFDNSNHFLISDPDTRKALYEKVDEYCKTYFGY